MYTIERGLGWKPMALFFAVATAVDSFGIGNMNQSNSVASLMNKTFGAPTWATGLVLAAATAKVLAQDDVECRLARTG